MAKKNEKAVNDIKGQEKVSEPQQIQVVTGNIEFLMVKLMVDIVNEMKILNKTIKGLVDNG